MSSTQNRDDADSDQMKCMEVWGGCRASSTCLHRPGLDVWIQRKSLESAESGGGDLHLLSSCASGRITRMLLADICGLGSMFTELAGELRDLMKLNVNAVQQERIVRDVSTRLEAAAHKGGFASMLISTFFAPTRSYSLCNTGHPSPLVFRASASEWTTLKQEPASPPASLSDRVVHPDEYQKIKTKLDVGDMVLSYGNVLTECRDADGQIIGQQGVLERARRLNCRPDEFLSMLLSDLRREHPENARAEDATVLLCRATETKVAWQDNLLAPLRLLRSASDNTAI